MLRLFPMLTSFPFLGQHLGSGPHYLAFYYSNNLLFLLWLPPQFFLSGPPPHHPWRGLVLGCCMSQSCVQTAAPPPTPHLGFTVKAHWIHAKLLQKPNGHPSRSVSYFSNMQRALISTIFIQTPLFFSLCICL